MSEDSPESNVTLDTEAFEDWVGQTAETKGLSRSEVLDQMMSSYWILEELTGMMDATAGEMGESGEGPSKSGAESDKQEDKETLSEQDLSALIEEFQSLRAAILEGTERPQANQVTEEKWAGQGGARAHEAPISGSGRIGQGVEGLRRTVEQLSRRVEDFEDDHESITELKSEFEEIEAKIGDLERAFEDGEELADLESLARELEEEQSRLQEELAEVRGRVSQLEDSQKGLSRELSGLRANQEGLEGMVDEEFDGIERLFQHLIDKTENLEYRLGAVSDTHSDDMETIDEYIERERRLSELKAEAQEKKIERAVCDDCETTIDIALLDKPQCPSCDRSVTGLKRSGWLPFSTHKFSTGPPPRTTMGGGDPLENGGSGGGDGDAPRRES